MFHHRPVSFSGDSAPQNVNLVSSGQRQNENLIHRGKNQKSSATNNKSVYNSDTIIGGKKTTKNLSKTPHGKKASTRRRAFGDISNKKANGGFGKESFSIKRNSQQNDVIKPRSNTLLPRAIRNVPTSQNTRFASLPEQPKPSRLEGALNEAANNRNKIGVQSLSSINHPLSIMTAQIKSQPPRKLDPVPDIEHSAGRTWKQQLEYDLKAEDDLDSISSIDSILNLKSCFSAKDSWRKERDFLWEHQKEKDDEEDRQVQEQMQAIMDREQKDELSILYNTIENLEIFSDSSHGNMHDDLKEEEWTTPDLSGFDLSLPDDLSFPL